MRFLSARQIFHDCFHVSYGGSTWQLLDPKTPRWDFSAHHASPTVNFKDSKVSRPNDGQVWNSMLQGIAQDIIAKLPEMPRSWGLFAYTDPFGQVHLDRLRQWLYRVWAADNLDDYNNNIHLNYRRQAKLLLSIDVALDGAKHVHITGEPATPSQIGEQIGVRNPLRDGWMARVHYMSMLIDKLDRRALSPLGGLVKRMQEKEST